MRRTIRTLCVAVVATTLIVSAAFGQQKGKGRGGFGGGGPLSPVVIVGNEAVQKDLGVSSDLAGKLTSLRDDMNAARQKEYQTAGINPQDFQNLTNEQRQKMAEIGNKLNDEFNPKLKAIISPDQYKRLAQIQLQSNLRNIGPGALTTGETAAELKLTDDQKQKLNALGAEFAQKQRDLFTGGGFDQAAMAKLRDERTTKTMELLTAEQKETLNKLKGSDFDVSQLGFGFGGRRGKGN